MGEKCERVCELEADTGGEGRGENMLINEATCPPVNMHLLKLYYNPGTALQSEGATAE